MNGTIPAGLDRIADVEQLRERHRRLAHPETPDDVVPRCATCVAIQTRLWRMTQLLAMPAQRCA